MSDRAHRLANLLQSLCLLLLLLALIWLLANWVLPDARLALGALTFGAVLSLSLPAWAGNLLLRRLRAVPLTEPQAPALIELLRELARRAALRRVPRLCYIPSPVPNAFALRAAGGTTIAITDGLLRRLNGMELAAVLAHEVGHIRNRDLFVLAFADSMVRLTHLLAAVGKILLLLALLLALIGGGRVPWLVALCLIIAPAVAELLRLALSRTREFDADREAARLLGRPDALASALRRLQAPRAGFWRRLLLGEPSPVPSYLRTHPSTASRVARLEQLGELPQWPPLVVSSSARPAGIRRSGFPSLWRRLLGR